VEKPIVPATPDPRKTWLDDPRAVDILTTEHWSLLSTRTLGYQEMLGRATIFVAVLSGVIVALALLAQVTRFGRETLAFALLLIAVTLFIGVATFIRSVEINYEDARCVRGMNLLRRAYLEIVPELEQFFVTGHEPDADRGALRHGLPQHLRNLAKSLTTTSGVVAALNSVLTGALVSDLAALAGAAPALGTTTGAGVSLLSAILHVRYAARFRRRHAPAQTEGNGQS
jgi:type III secretory pathway component EscS